MVTFLLGFLALPFPAIAGSRTVLILDSQAGDYIGGGQNRKLTPALGTFQVSAGTANGAHISYNGGAAEWWNLDFTSPPGKSFGIGEYDNTYRYPFNASRAGLDVSGDGRGCDTSTGRFVVSDFAVDNATGKVKSLAIDFEQHCEGASPALFGSFRYNSEIPLTPALSVGRAVARKGNAGTSDGQVIVGLSMPSKTPISVHFRTADGTAIQGRDYLATSGIVRFPPGETVQYATVPIVGNRAARGTTSFSVKLFGPSGTTIVVPNGGITIQDPNGPVNALWMNSPSGDYIGGGVSQLITDQDGPFRVQGGTNGLEVNVDNPDNWTLDFYAPSGQPLVPRAYKNAQRYPFQSPKLPGLSVYGAGRGCNTLSGNFDVNAYDIFNNGTISGFSADFLQRCEGTGPALAGAIRYNAPLRQFSVTNAVIQGGGAFFFATLNPASSTEQRVTFRTVGWSAVEGTDFTSVNKPLVFEPGEREKVVFVPIHPKIGAGKVFYGQISTPGVMPVWIGTGAARL
jgi:urease beta subunit